MSRAASISRRVEWLLAVILIVLVILSLRIGAYPVSIAKICRILWSLTLHATPAHPAWVPAEQVVIQVIRLPRIALAILAGAGLALCGASLQGVLRNPLVAPDIVGVTAGAVAGGVVAIFFEAPAALIVVMALAGGLVALVLAGALARLAGGSLLALVLSGIVVAAFFSAVVSTALLLSDPGGNLQRVLFWTLGSFSGADRVKVATLAIPELSAGAVLLALRWRLNLLSLGESDARALGLEPRRLRWLVVILISVIVAAQVAVSGAIGWIGLIIPHAGRMIVGPDHRRLLPVAALLGAIFTLAVDDIARLITQQELPIGLLTSFVGAPVFAVLLWRSQVRGWSRD